MSDDMFSGRLAELTQASEEMGPCLVVMPPASTKPPLFRGRREWMAAMAPLSDPLWMRATARIVRIATRARSRR